MAFELFAPLFEVVDSTTAKFINEVSSRAITAITPIATAGLTLSFIMQGLLAMRGKIDMPLMDLGMRMFTISIISGVAMAGGLYQTEIMSAMQTLPDDLATTLLSNNTATTAANMLDSAAGTSFNLAGEAWQKAGMMSSSGWMFGTLAFFILLSTVLLLAIGGAILMLAKVACSIIIAIGPFFIFALLWQPTKRLFDSWIAQFLTYTLLVVVFSAAFGFAISIFDKYVAGVKLDGTQNVMYNIGGLMLLAGALGFLLYHMPAMSQALGGGISFDLPRRSPKNNKGKGRDAGKGDGSGSNAAPSGQQGGTGNQGGSRGGSGGSGSGGPAARGYANRRPAAASATRRTGTR
ncbi:type IV secretion system protein [Achromobacter ruhlandii]|uniref:type IV secretion system protein n=1 Tax=Achromobacter ruhlandii TaxID=72557 RepID=UPI003BA33207